MSPVQFSIPHVHTHPPSRPQRVVWSLLEGAGARFQILEGLKQAEAFLAESHAEARDSRSIRSPRAPRRAITWSLSGGPAGLS